jgi:hypothetical protein
VFADVLKPVVEFMQPLIEAFASWAAMAGTGAIVSLLALLAGVILTVTLALSPLIAVMIAIGYVVQKATAALSGFLRSIGIGGRSAAGGSVGVAVRPATIGSVEDYGRKAMQAAFSLGAGAGPEERTANVLDELYKYFKENFISDLMKALKDVIPGAKTAERAVESVADGARDMGRRIEGAIDDIESGVRRTVRSLDPRGWF